MEEDKSTNPEDVCFLGPVGVVLHSKGIPDLFEEFFGLGSGIHHNKRSFLRDIMSYYPDSHILVMKE